MIPLVQQFRTLLLALVLALPALPDGVTVCLRRLVAESAGSACCSRGCNREPDSRPRLEVRAERCARCCLSVPSSERRVDPKPAPVFQALELPPVLSFFGVEPRIVSELPASRASRGRSLATGPPPLPLRI